MYHNSLCSCILYTYGKWSKLYSGKPGNDSLRVHTLAGYWYLKTLSKLYAHDLLVTPGQFETCLPNFWEKEKHQQGKRSEVFLCQRWAAWFHHLFCVCRPVPLLLFNFKVLDQGGHYLQAGHSPSVSLASYDSTGMLLILENLRATPVACFLSRGNWV